MEGIGVLSGNCHALWPNLCVPVPFSRVARLAAASGLRWDGTSQAFSLQNACVREQCVWIASSHLRKAGSLSQCNTVKIALNHHSPCS